ncbi:MAG: hypothetical protein WC554_02905 [Clostridia bacterium]|jgi:sorbitol-specific phosphotransferase system component IIA
MKLTKITDVTDQKFFKVRCDDMLQTIGTECKLIVTKSGKEKIDKLLKNGHILYNSDGKYQPRITGAVLV